MRILVYYLLLCATSSLSQNSKKEAVAPIGESHFTIGTRGSFGHSFIYPYKNCAANASYQIGIGSLFQNGSHIGLSLDALFSSEGATFTFDDGIKQSAKLEYMRIPARFNYFFRESKNDFRPKLGVGGSYGLLFKSEDSDSYQTADFGLNAAAGFSYRLLRGFWLHMDASWYEGLRDIQENEDGMQRNGALRIEVALMVGL